MNPVSFEFKNAWLAQVQGCKGNPFENYLRDLSTNERPAFRALDQSEALVSARFLVLVKSGVYQSEANVPIDIQWSGTGLFIGPFLYSTASSLDGLIGRLPL